jgi:lysozyme family protein
VGLLTNWKQGGTMNAKDVALGFTLGYEGEWVNDPDDRGGETYRGISRVNWPKWAGWEIIDAEKQKDSFPARLVGMSDLSELVLDFYLVNFWEPIHGEELPPKMAVALFDFAVNSGPVTAVRMMQIVLRVFVDGEVGPKTVKAAHDAGEGAVIEMMARRAKFLHEVMDNDPSQQAWCLNWFRRLFRLANIVLEG